MQDDPIYIPHSSEFITEVMNEFRDFMHDPECTALSLTKSVEILNYYTYASQLDEHQTGRLEGLLMEAEMRIQLMANMESSVLSEKEAFKKALMALDSLGKQLKTLYRRSMNTSPTFEELIEWVEKRKGYTRHKKNVFDDGDCWRCHDCSYEWSFIMGDNEVPEICPYCLDDKG